MPASSSAMICLPAFTPGQSAATVDASLKEALAACDRARHCAVTWFAEIKRRALYRELGHPSLQVYAVQALGFTDNRYWQFTRLADDLERLPALREALDDGRLGWTKAQQVARVATAQTQEAWVAKAAACGRRELAQAVRAATGTARARAKSLASGRSGLAGDQVGSADLFATSAAGSPSEDAPPTPMDAGRQHDATPPGQPGAPAATVEVAAPLTVTLRADALQLARFEALVEKARRLRRLPVRADRMEVVLAALDALVAGDSVQATDDGARATSQAKARRSPSPVQVVVQQCPDCAAASAVTRRGEARLAPAQAEAVLCDARVREGRGPNRATIPPSVRAAVLTRDRHRCATAGCGATRFLEVHHVVPRRRGGSNRAENLVTVCSRCHGFMHEREAAGLAVAELAPDGIERVGLNLVT
jgi:5-methylcytosine-specific restriction endonuclease McrA